MGTHTLTEGNMKAMEMNKIQSTAPTATGYENAPKWKGPRTNCLR